MPKRKHTSNDDDDDDGSSSSDDVDVVDVSFDFFDPNPQVDYHAIKRLLRQLFQRDAERLLLHELTELILSQPTVGTTIKTDGVQSDPLALLTALNMRVHRENPSIKAIVQYLLSLTNSSDSSAAAAQFHSTLDALFSPTSEAQIGLVLCERLVNMPSQVVPPMYAMLADEMKWAVADGEPYSFTHLLVFSRVYHLSEEEESILDDSSTTKVSPSGPSPKKQKKARAQAQAKAQASSSSSSSSRTMARRPRDGIYCFHPEDEIIADLATRTLTYAYQSPLPPLVQESRTNESFGLDVRGRVFLLEGGGEALVREIGARAGVRFAAG